MAKHNHLIKVNDVSVEKKTVLWKKTVFSFIIVMYMLIVIMFCAFSNETWTNKLNMPKDANAIFACLFMLTFLPIVIGVTFEINKLFFGVRNKTSYFLLLLGTLSLYLAPNIVYICYCYFNDEITKGVLQRQRNLFHIFVWTITCASLMMFIILTCLIKNNHMNSIKQITTLVLIYCVSSFGMFSVIFIGLLKGWIILIYFFMITSLNDTFAYLSGLLFGKHKVAPIVSPKKTWEGLIGGVVISTGICLLVYYGMTFDDNTQNSLLHFKELINANWYLQWIFITVFIICMAVGGTIGDLFYSYIKRVHNIKDYSNLLKEHGGFLDRFDSAFLVFFIYTFLLFFITAVSTENTLWPPQQTPI